MKMYSREAEPIIKNNRPIRPMDGQMFTKGNQSREELEQLKRVQEDLG